MFTVLRTIIMMIVKTIATKFISERMTKEVIFKIAEEITSWTPSEKDDLIVKLAKDNLNAVEVLKADKTDEEVKS